MKTLQSSPHPLLAQETTNAARLGLRSRVTAEASSAIAALASGPPPDAMLVDYRLAGGQDGLATITSIREAARAAIPALLVSGENHAGNWPG